MQLTKEDVLRLGKLSRVKLENVDQMTDQLHQIFDWIEKLNQAYEQVSDISLVVDTKNKHLERKEENPSEDQHERMLTNAPKRAHRFFVVPKVKD